MKDIVLTTQELEELKDAIKFREKVILQLKQLNGIPKKVWTLGVWTGVHTLLIIGVFLAIIGFACKVIASGQ